MAAATEDAGSNLPPPPGFESFEPSSPPEPDLRPDEMQEFQEFMSTVKGFGNTTKQNGGGASGSGGGGGLKDKDFSVEVTKPNEGPMAGMGEIEPVLLDESMKFEDLKLSPNLLRGVYEMGFVRPSKIQAAALPMIVRKDNGKMGRNMIGQAQNGSGKTATFALAVLSLIDVANETPQALVLCPTRELARQNEQVISNLGTYLPAKCLVVIPSQDRVNRSHPCHVVIGTPGKILDLGKKRVVDLWSVKCFVLDEADVMLDQDNAMGPQVTQIRKFLPQELQVLFFSATYPDDVRTFAEALVPRPINIKVKKTDLTVSTVTQMYVLCEDTDADKLDTLASLYGAMNVGQSVVFVNARARAFRLAKQMKDLGFAVSLICGTQQTGEERMDPALRDTVMDEFRNGVTKVLIATDVLARGIDVPQVTLVVNYELPLQWHDRNRGVDMETYLHRVGRTGRFGLKGIAVNLVTSEERQKINDVCDFFACRITESSKDFEQLEERLKELR
eukprot:TRINITY_DN5461_c0_g1_i1.p1 TRINITY_DN5461_c0_g1~~TRINITY_DN5461_c0_g1_i1.p1  ORF type:complete len:503 (+),score=119.51 TRINITY_DN5461_c0_g1_i1:167-1675(+)